MFMQELIHSQCSTTTYLRLKKRLKTPSLCETQAFWLQGRKTNISVVTRCLRAPITTQDLLVMRYKMSSYISSVFPCLRFLLPCTSFLPSFIYPSIIQGTLFFFSLLSLSPTHFSQNTFLSFILSPSASYSSHLSSSSLCLSVFWTLLLVLSVSLHPASTPSFPPLSPVMNESVCWVQFIFTEQGSAHCQSLLPSTSLFLH